MRNHLYSRAQVFSATFLAKDFTINFPCRHIWVLIQIDINEAFIVTKVQVCLCAIVCDKYFPVLVRAHRPWVNIDIRVKFLDRHFQSTIFEQATKTCCDNPFPDGWYDTTRDKNIFCWHVLSSSSNVVEAIPLCRKNKNSSLILRELRPQNEVPEQYLTANGLLCQIENFMKMMFAVYTTFSTPFCVTRNFSNWSPGMQEARSLWIRSSASKRISTDVSAFPWMTKRAFCVVSSNL